MISQEELMAVTQLKGEELEKFSKFIKSRRKKLIPDNPSIVESAWQTNSEEIVLVLKDNDISKAIVQLRQYTYEAYLKQENKFNAEVLKEICSKFEYPQARLQEVCEEMFKLPTDNFEIFKKNLIENVGAFVGSISPYIYCLCLSNTQSRRSRAGKTFEAVIYKLYEYFHYSFDSQKQLGRKIFSNIGLGKIVDSVLPGVEEFNAMRTKVIIGSMKTTLRERWQEVVEEVTRSNIPTIHLLTVDDDISQNKVEQMAEHNIVLVVLNDVKQQDNLVRRRTVITFESYFLKELPEMFKYWKNQG